MSASQKNQSRTTSHAMTKDNHAEHIRLYNEPAKKQKLFPYNLTVKKLRKVLDHMKEHQRLAKKMEANQKLFRTRGTMEAR